nr:MAG TPA: hypothetical protein [Caudoviricetes sp.]
MVSYIRNFFLFCSIIHIIFHIHIIPIFHILYPFR